MRYGPFKTEKTVYYTRSLKRPNRWGNVETACSRKEVVWNVRLANGRVLEGFDTKRDANHAWLTHVNGR